MPEPIQPNSLLRPKPRNWDQPIRVRSLRPELGMALSSKLNLIVHHPRRIMSRWDANVRPSVVDLFVRVMRVVVKFSKRSRWVSFYGKII